MKKTLIVITAVIILAMVSLSLKSGIAASKKAFPEVPRMTKEELLKKLGNPDLTLLDVRTEQQWKISEKKFPVRYMKTLETLNRGPTSILKKKILSSFTEHDLESPPVPVRHFSWLRRDFQGSMSSMAVTMNGLKLDFPL